MLWAVPQSRNASLAQALKNLTTFTLFTYVPIVSLRIYHTTCTSYTIYYLNLEPLGMHYMPINLIVTFNRVGIDVHIQIFAGHTLVQTEQIVTVRFKMRGGIKRL